jgi:thiamine-phosphate pyrophosphorylase
MKCEKNQMLLYAVTDRSWVGESTLYRQVEAALKGGVTMVQLREKELSQEAFFEEAKFIGELCHRYHVPFIINDNVELARAVDADGVHVGQHDMLVEEARNVLGENKIIGVSAHNIEEARRACVHGADYLGAGAVFGSATKTDAGTLDHMMLKEICASVDIPVVAIGGINQSNIQKLRGLGISGVAVVSAVFAQPDIEMATAELKEQARLVVE